ncbi:SIR2 family NAD-dependent protein deacylase [Lachnospiraceae bacterium LCP25S3_G4]
MGLNLRDILESSKYTVALSGFGMLLENGYPALRDGEESYDIEQKYGYSMEELFHSSFYNTRKELFYEFYRQEVLKPVNIPPGRGFCALAELERTGLIQATITRRIYGLPTRAGCKHVIEMHGNIFENYCPHCGKQYSMQYVQDSKKIPLCSLCNTPIRPKVCLFGEMVDNAIMTKAAEEVAKADVLLILGTNLKTYLCEQLIGYYEGNKMILITRNEHFSDKYADYVVHSRVDDALLGIIDNKVL